MKSIIDNVAIHAVGAPDGVLQMKLDLISKIAAESSDNCFQLEHLSPKLMVLQAGIETCK